MRCILMLLSLTIIIPLKNSALAAQCFVTTANSAAPPRELYIIAGQSNAVGLASVDDITSGTHDYFNSTTQYPQVKIYGIYGAPDGVIDKDNETDHTDVDWSSYASWQSARPGFGFKGLSLYKTYINPSATTATLYRLFGPELGLSLLLAAHPPYDHYIVKLAVAGTSLSNDWTQPGHLYQELLEMIAAAYNSKRDTVRLRIAGIFWMQGETDALAQPSANAYQANLRQFINSIRADIAAMECPTTAYAFPIVIGRIQDNAVWTYRNAVRTAQQNITVAAPDTALTNTDDFAAHLLSDGVHFNEYGQAQLGIRTYHAWQHLQR